MRNATSSLRMPAVLALSAAAAVLLACADNGDTPAAPSLDEVAIAGAGDVLALAAHVGATRLIDNITLGAASD